VGLLDDMLEKHDDERKTKKQREAEFMAVPVAVEPVAQDQLDIQEGPQTWFGDPSHTICGMSPGNAFEMLDCGEELDGLWIVAKVDAPPGAPDERRKLVAHREAGGPPYMQITEDVVREEIEAGRLVPKKREVTPEAAPSPDEQG